MTSLSAHDVAALRLIGALGEVGDVLHTVMSRHVQRTDAISNKAVKLLVALLLDGPSQPKQLRARLGIAASDLSKTINKLEREGLAERRRHANDGRSYVIHPTGRGEALIADVVSTISSGLDDPEGLARRLDSFIDRIRPTLDEAGSAETSLEHDPA